VNPAQAFGGSLPRGENEIPWRVAAFGLQCWSAQLVLQPLVDGRFYQVEYQRKVGSESCPGKRSSSPRSSQARAIVVGYDTQLRFLHFHQQHVTYPEIVGPEGMWAAQASSHRDDREHRK
jgi:hypothetical protein